MTEEDRLATLARVLRERYGPTERAAEPTQAGGAHAPSRRRSRMPLIPFLVEYFVLAAQDLTTAQIADQLGVSRHAVYQRRYHARQAGLL